MMEAKNSIYHDFARTRPEVCPYGLELLRRFMALKVRQEACMLRGAQFRRPAGACFCPMQRKLTAHPPADGVRLVTSAASSQNALSLGRSRRLLKEGRAVPPPL